MRGADQIIEKRQDYRLRQHRNRRADGGEFRRGGYGRALLAPLRRAVRAGLPGAESAQDKGSNYTRFITLSKKLEIYPGSDKTSVKLVVSHKPGSLYRILSRFNALGININKLESRPIPDRDFEFMLYFDLDTPIYSEEFLELINALDLTCEQFEYLGSYLEVI